MVDQQGLKGQGTEENWQQGSELNVANMPNIHVNNISSYFVAGFVIVDGIKVEAILGIGFLEMNRCVLDVCRGELIVKYVALWPHSSSKPSCLMVTLVKTITIPAASEMEVMARMCIPGDEYIWMIEGKQQGYQYKLPENW